MLCHGQERKAIIEALLRGGPDAHPEMLIARQSYTPQGPDGEPVRAEERFSDYRAVEGVQIPYTASVYRDGAPVLERMLTRVVINGPIDDQLFARPR